MVTTIEELKKVKTEIEAELPPFSDGTPLTVRLRYIDVSEMATSINKIPNPLNNAVNKLTNSTEISKEEKEKKTKWAEENTEEATKVLEPIAEKALIEPTYSDICKYAGGLTSFQILAIYSIVAHKPVKQYEKFCDVPTDTECNSNGENVQAASK